MDKITDKDLEIIEKLMKLMSENTIDALEFGDIKLVKTQHIPSGAPEKETKQEVSEDDLLFYSAQ